MSAWDPSQNVTSDIEDVVAELAGGGQDGHDDSLRRRVPAVNKRMVQPVKQSEALHTDDTSIPVLAPRRTARAWVFVSDAQNPYAVFDLSDSRQQEFPKLLAGYRGFIQADGYAGCNPLDAAGAHVGCWAHTRRYFFEAKERGPEVVVFERTLTKHESYYLAVNRRSNGVGLSVPIVGRDKRLSSGDATGG